MTSDNNNKKNKRKNNSSADFKWSGREPDSNSKLEKRYHHIVKPFEKINISAKLSSKNLASKKAIIVGFVSDLGVLLNKGRVGAANAPNAIRKALANLPIHHNMDVFDAGNIVNKHQNLSLHQKDYSIKLLELLSKNHLIIGLGGGHEIAHPSFVAALNFIPHDKTLGIINFDAHFDLRPITKVGPTSGNPFMMNYLLSKKNHKDFNYFVCGITREGNTKQLFKTAEDLNVTFITNLEVLEDEKLAIKKLISFAEKFDYLYITICMDVLSAAYAPGVSATNPYGLSPGFILQTMSTLVKKHKDKVIIFDIAETNPKFDIDNQTAKLAALFLDHFLFSINN